MKTNHTCSSRRMGCPISAIGTVNLTNGKNSQFGTVWDCWSEGDGSFLLVKAGEQAWGVFGSGSLESAQKTFQIGDTIELCHDQSNRKIGNRWEIIAVLPYTKEGMLQAKTLSGCGRIPFGTFK